MLGTALAGQSCTTVTDFSYAKLNQESSSLHLTTFMAHFENGALHLAGKSNFESRPNMCLRSIQVAPTKEGSPMPVVTVQTFYKRYKVETGKGVFTSDAEGKIDFGEGHCDVSSFSVEGNEAALKSVDYCTAQTAVGGNAKRSVQIRDVEGVATEGTKPIIPVPYCVGGLGSENGHSYCLGVFSYINGNNFTVALDSNHTFFVPAAPAFSMAPTNYYAGEQEAAVGTTNHCSRHEPKSPTLRNSLMTSRSTFACTVNEICFIGSIYKSEEGESATHFDVSSL